MSILALETSCDDTCAAVVDSSGAMLANVVSSQDVHDRFGGVVPEIASRHHLELVNLVVAQALDEAGVSLSDVDLIAATQGPGLVGALLVGLSTAKALAAARQLPLAAVDHLQGHVAANYLLGGDDSASGSFDPPFVCLIASGGHTLLVHVREHDRFEVLGRTLDDAAGEAFDKAARMLGLGYPGGAALEELARAGDAEAFSFPGSNSERARGGWGTSRNSFAQGLDFSFAGVKTALLYRLRELSPDDARARAADLAASYQAAVVDSLVVRVERALELTGLDRLAVGGGVAANGELRRRLRSLGSGVHIPGRALCTDNAAMIASAARYGEQLPYPRYLGLDAYATGERPL
ncbi:MAG: tRNA (adenosine(37)-N6)-threonylcarbamoyltransferase complex transferase subunit TsaD [Actinobacteria bacterium]|nr:MAG: tRNA (adenosine(37)-N6)-threonylcarbamoyltransferase complex transferase subunit TsaD [Actinomycetota bacterium]